MHDPTNVTAAQTIRAHVAHARQHPEDADLALAALADLADYLSDDVALVKMCACCDALYDAASWAALELVGTSDDGLERIEQRNCTCGTTLGVVLGPSPR